MKVIIYYISGHGYGHFTRSATVMKALLDQDVADQIIVRTKVSEKVFLQTLPNHYTSSNRTCRTSDKNGSVVVRSEPPHELDAGTVQSSPLDIDPLQTLRNHAELFGSKEKVQKMMQEEISFVKQYHHHDEGKYSPTPSVENRSQTVIAILCDASPLGIAVANELHIPGILISNFDWCAIMDHFFQQVLHNHRNNANDMKHQEQKQKQILLVEQEKEEKCNEDDEQKMNKSTNNPLFQDGHSEEYNDIKFSLNISKEMYSTATIVIRPRAALIPSPVPYTHNTQILDVPWICPTVLRSNISSTGESFDACRKRLESELFQEATTSTNKKCKIVLVTFGGQPGSVSSSDKSKSQSKSTDGTGTDNDPDHNDDIAITNNIDESDVRLGFIFATQDAKCQTEFMKKHGYNGGIYAPAMTSDDARKVAFNNSPQNGSIAELTRISDLILGKPGYGTVCETIASGGRMVYVNREPQFLEERFLIQEFGNDVEDGRTSSTAAVKLDRRSFEARRWHSSILKALSYQKCSKDSSNAPELNGAEVICDIIMKLSSQRN